VSAKPVSRGKTKGKLKISERLNKRDWVKRKWVEIWGRGGEVLREVLGGAA